MTSDSGPLTTDYRRGLHWWAVLTACAALPLVLLGAEVTTRQVGMADEVGFRTPWHLATLWLERTLKPRGLGFLIEHSHRLAGFVVGSCAIVLAVWSWLRAPTRWLRWLGVAALVGVSLQGLLGGFRVNLHQLLGPDLALVHGCFGQMVFALLVSVALLSSRGWSEPVEHAAPDELPRARRTAWFALLVTGLVVGQLIFGAVLRHKGSPLGQRLHLLLAFGVVAAVVWLLRLTADDRRLSGAARLLVALVALQVLLGVEAWMIRFAGFGLTLPEEVIWRRDLTRSAHVLTGALILAASVAATLEAFRRAAPAASPAAEPVGQLEGAA
jgi:cytochrome c oxidase assembly protein subunit 15